MGGAIPRQVDLGCVLTPKAIVLNKVFLDTLTGVKMIFTVTASKGKYIVMEANEQVI